MTDRADEKQAEHLLRELAPQVLGAVMRRFHDFAAAEDAVQEALIAAALQWPRDGVPDESSRLADSGRRAAHDGLPAQRGGAPPPGERIGRAIRLDARLMRARKMKPTRMTR